MGSPQSKLSRATGCLGGRYRQQCDPAQHRSESPSIEVSFRQEKPIVAGMFHQPSSGLHQPLLQTGKRPVIDSSGQCQSPPQIPQVVSEHAQPQPHLVGAWNR